MNVCELVLFVFVFCPASSMKVKQGLLKLERWKKKKKKVDHRKSHFYSALVRLLEGANCKKEGKNQAACKKQPLPP